MKPYVNYTSPKKTLPKLQNAAPKAQSLPIYSPVGLLNSKSAGDCFIEHKPLEQTYLHSYV